MTSCCFGSTYDNPTKGKSKNKKNLKKQHKNGQEILRLKCSIHNYKWGITGNRSQVARLFSLNSGSKIDPQLPHAELWIGTHQSGPSFVVNNNCGFGLLSLKDWILEHNHKPSLVLGQFVVDKWGPDLPFLFKVLSIEKALSIQVHPNKEMARILNKSCPALYKDDNHKPEMALALTDFEALCGFISVPELKSVIRNVPEITELIGYEKTEKFLQVNEEDVNNEEARAFLKSLFTRLILLSNDEVSLVIRNLTNRLQLEMQERNLTKKEELVLRLEQQYPEDVGVIASFLLNQVMLKPGEALYLAANEPHAYISGECIECMGNSDNVVRAGLTRKQRDITTLLSMLQYNQGRLDVMQGVPIDPYIMRYSPNLDEFEVDHCILPQGGTILFPSVPGPCLFLVFKGEGRIVFSGFSQESKVKCGTVLFVPANVELQVKAKSLELELYRAGVNCRVFDNCW